MPTPMVSPTAALSHHTSRDHLTAYEIVLGFAVATALAIVAAFALAIPSTSASSADPSTGAPAVSNGQIARGKATLPQSAPNAHTVPGSIDY